MSDTIHLYVNMPGNDIPGTSFAAVVEALASLLGVPTSERGKAFPAPISALPPVIIHIGEGIYREKLVITRPNITLEGAGADHSGLWGCCF